MWSLESDRTLVGQAILVLFRDYQLVTSFKAAM